jgi:hypothetical protein
MLVCRQRLEHDGHMAGESRRHQHGLGVGSDKSGLQRSKTHVCADTEIRLKLLQHGGLHIHICHGVRKFTQPRR